jgi:glycerol-3-phosphate dehydrogenase
MHVCFKARNFHYTEERAPLEFQMTREAAKNHNQQWLDVQVNVPRRRCGLLMVAFNEEELNTIKDMEVKALQNGEDVRIIGYRELRSLEPHLEVASEAIAALHSPEEYVVDPYLLPLSNLYVALHHGCQLVTRCRVVHVQKESQPLWKVEAESRTINGGKLSTIFYRARKVINCGGNYSDELDTLVPRTIDEAKPFTIKPGLGEFVVLEAAAAKNGLNTTGGPMGMVTQVPTKTYAGLYIFNSVYGNVVVGPTNIKQESKEDRGCSVESKERLESHIFKYFPGLEGRKLVATYAGLRPGCEESNDYQIRFSRDKTWATLGAIRSTGLTASRPIAEYCARNLFGHQDYEAMPRLEDVVMPAPVPQANGSIKVGLFTFRPTHKLSQLGIKKVDTTVKSSL